jgi:hypothetical protein
MSKLSIDDVRRTLINPFYAISIDPMLCNEHEPLITKEEWIKAQKINIEEDGIDLWLETLLEVLEGEYPRNEDNIILGYK